MSWQWLVAPGSALYLIPLAAIVGIAAMARSTSARRPVMAWWLAMAVACLLTAASKIAFYGWGTGIRAWDLTCFSGHTVMALSVWPVALMLVFPPSRPGWRAFGCLAGTALSGLIGYSRIPLGAHPPSEVIAGALLGCLAGAAGVWILRRQGLTIRLAPLATLLVVILAIAVPGRRMPMLPSEQWFASIGIALSGREAPVNRKKWRLVTAINDSRGTNLRG